jgi:hypothetical protein
VTSILTSNSYDFSLVAGDYFGSTEVSGKVSSGFVPAHFRAGGKGIGIGMRATKDAFEVGMPAYLGDGLLNNGVRGARIQFNVDGDANTYYPVIIVPPFLSPDMVKLSVSRVFSDPAPNTWYTSTHKGGLTLTVFCTGYSTWSGNSSAYSVLEHAETYSTICSGIDVHAGSGLIFFLRGGGASYNVTGDCWLGASVTVHLGGYTAPDGAVFPAMAYSQAKVNSSINAKRLGGGVSSVSWNDILSKPSTFAPTSHTHTAAQLPNAYSLLWSGTISAAGATATLGSAYSNFDFLIVVIALDNASSENHVSVTIPVGTISTNARRFSGGLYMSSSNYMYLNFTFPSTTSIEISNLGGALTKAIRYVYGVKIA